MYKLTVGHNKNYGYAFYLLNVVKVSISPIEHVIGVVNGKAIGPLDLSGNDGGLVVAVHPNTAYESFISPVCPVHISAGNRQNLFENLCFFYRTKTASKNIYKTIILRPNLH